MKRILRIAAVALFAASLCLLLLSCGNGKKDDKGLIYTLDKATDTYTVTGYTGNAKEIEIPAKYDSKLVAAIGTSAFNGNVSITKVTIPSSVKTIGSTAFYGCTELTEVVFSEGSELKEIPTGAFSGCPKLDGVIIPDSVTRIGYKAFNNCTSMKTVTFPDSLEIIDFYAFSGCASLNTVSVIPIRAIKTRTSFYKLFKNNENLTGLNRLALCCVNGSNRTVSGCVNFVLHLHSFENAKNVSLFNCLSCRNVNRKNCTGHRCAYAFAFCGSSCCGCRCCSYGCCGSCCNRCRSGFANLFNHNVISSSVYCNF